MNLGKPEGRAQGTWSLFPIPWPLAPDPYSCCNRRFVSRTASSIQARELVGVTL